MYGTDHVIINNYMEGLNGTRWDAPITLTQGDAIDGQSSNLSKHFRAERITIAFNTLINNSHGIEIGFDNNDNYNKDLADITIANNLITGSENSLVEIVDTDNDQGDKITWSNNLLYPTANAALLTGATSTSFDATEVINENPHLVFDPILNVWKSTGDTPLYENAITTGGINEDIEGQGRPNTSNPGADHFSMESIRYAPLTPDDVGPNAYEDNGTSSSTELKTSEATAHPNPVNNTLYLSNIGSQTSDLKIVTLEGKVVLSRKIQDDTRALTINTSRLANGTYILQLYSKNGSCESQKVVVQH